MQLFEKEGHKIFHGDIIEVLSSGKIKDKTIDLIFIDPPYNIGKKFNGKKYSQRGDEYLNWCYEWIDLCLKKLKDTGSMYIMTSTQFMSYFDIFLRDRIEILSRIVWYYDSSGVQAKKYFGSMYEPILFCVMDKKNYIFNSEEISVAAKTGATRKLIDYRKNPPQRYNTKKVPGNVWEFPRVRYRMSEYENHPTQKPVKLLERIIKASSNPGDIVLDPFSGTFTTSSVAKSLNRKSIGIELEEEYIKIGLRRTGLATHYNGERLEKEAKTYEREKIASSHVLKLFEEPDGTQLYQSSDENTGK